MDLRIGDVVQTKKPHPCGSEQWEIVRVGMDIRLRCIKCGRLVLIPRLKAEKSIKKILHKAAD